MQFIEFLTGLSPDDGSGYTELGYIALLGAVLAIAAVRRAFRRFS